LLHELTAGKVGWDEQGTRDLVSGVVGVDYGGEGEEGCVRVFWESLLEGFGWWLAILGGFLGTE
jgi:hypothetical protein